MLPHEFARNRGVMPTVEEVVSEQDPRETREVFIDEHYVQNYNLMDEEQAHIYSEVYKRIMLLVNSGKANIIDSRKLIHEGPEPNVTIHLEWIEYGLKIKKLNEGTEIVEQAPKLQDEIERIKKELHNESK